MIGAILLGVIGLAFVSVGYLIWKKERLCLLHDCHCDKVASENKKAFCAMAGWGVISIGLGILATAVLIGRTDSAWSFVAFVIGFGAGIALLISAERKYNH